MVFNCKICGGALDIKKIQRIVTCPYCGVQQTLPRTDNDEIANLYERANHFLRSNDYDKAESIYNAILNIDSTDAEAYWSIVLCKYGVEYVKDPKTGEYIPTCNRTQVKSIFTDEDYKQALVNSSQEEKEMYQKQAEQINEIQKKILEISKKEPPYDVFICYKEKDENGERTNDSVLAQDIYTKLMNEGLRVFFSRITLEDKLGTEYEPYIYAALNSAKVMLVIGTNKDYFYAPWVRNEWSRYLALTRQDKDKVLIPCFKDMDVYDIPNEFAHIQAQDMNKIGFMQDLIRGIKKVTNTDIEQGNVINKKTISPEQKEKRKKRIKSIIRNSAIILIIALLINIFVNKVFIQPKKQYDYAMEKLNNKEYYSAIEEFSKLDDYKDSKKKIEEAKLKWRKANSNIICTVTDEEMKPSILAVKQIGSVTRIGGDNVEQITEPIELKKDGTVEVTSSDYSFLNDEIKSWNNIVSIASSDYYVFGVTKEGNVKSVKISEGEGEFAFANLDVSDWKNIIQVVPCLMGGVVGLKEDGTVVSKGIDKSCILSVKEWKDVVQLAGSNTFLVALKKDGTVDRVYTAPYENLELQDEKDVIQLSKNDYYSNNVSLIKEDGTVITYGDEQYKKCETYNWKDMVYMYSNSNCVYGVTKNGTIKKAGNERI